jgi:tetratricopeptide (TPR) repeat protein
VGSLQGRPLPFFSGLFLLALTAGLASLPARAGNLPTPAECEARFAANPEVEASSACFAENGRDEAGKADAIRRVEALLQLHPRNGWLTFYLGTLLWNEPARSADLFATAAGLLAERGETLGEVRACSNRVLQLAKQGRQNEAASDVQRAIRVAEASGDRLSLARARITEAIYLIDRDEDLPQAYRLLLDARERLTPGDPYNLRRDCLFHLARLAIDLARLDEAVRLAREAVDLAGSEHDTYFEASARYSLLRAVREKMYLLPGSGDREEAEALARHALAVAETAGHREAAGMAHGILGLLTGGSESELHFRLCDDLASRPSDRSYCRSLQARRLTAEDPQRALRLLDEALDLAKEADAPGAIAYAWRERMRVSWRLGTPGQAVTESMTALDSIELLRDLQAPTEGRAEIFANWASHYHWLAGRLLETVEAGDRQALDTAFLVQERMRARALIDSLAAANAAPPAPPGSTEFSTLAEVRQALAPDEALLSFQIAPWEDMVGDFAGGAWLTVVTRDGATVHSLRSPLAERTRLRPAVEVFSGLFQGNGDDGDAAAALYQALLADGLSGLGPGIRRLVIVPDDVLHLLPFAALRPDPGGAPLATRYEITLTPSATLWLRWRQEAAATSGASALVLADPVSAISPPASTRAAGFPPANLGALPWARLEGKAVLRHLGWGSRLLVGADASEAYLKAGPVPYGILHFATHTWTSDNEPGQSYVLLAPGASNQDGRLHPGEIVGLKLRGRIVVLSTCSSASGEILRGEGVLGLARAFFQAGANTVVATLWPLRDDDGAALFDRFYRHLGEGMSVAAALHTAQRDRMAEGAAPAAWAGVVVLGDGDRVPIPGGRWVLPRFTVPLALAASGLLVLVFLARRRRVRA